MTPSSPAQVSTPNAPTPPPVFASDPQGKKPRAKSQNTTFLGTATDAVQSGATQGKTLLGQ